MGMDSIYIALRVGITCIVFAFFVFVPLKSRFRYSYARTALFVLLLIAITVAVTIFFLISGQFLYHYNFLGILLWITCAVVIFHVTIRGSTLEILFTVLVVLNLYANILTIAKIIVQIMDQPDNAQQIYMLVSLVVLPVNVPLLWLLFSRLYKRVVEFDIRLSFWKYIWIIPALIYLIYYIKIGTEYYGPNALSSSSGDLIFMGLWSLIVYLFFVVLLIMLIQVYSSIKASEETRMIASILRMQEGQYDQLLKNIEHNSRLRHDWRHHLLSLNGFAESGDLPGLQDYLKELIPEYTSSTGMPLCQNHVIDVISQYYAGIAEQSGIDMQLSLQIPNQIPIADPDLCILFGNLLENAVNACQTQTDTDRQIRLQVQTKDQQLIVIVRNTYSNPVIKQDGGYLSTKHEGPGIGLASVQQVVKKHRGLIKIEHNGTYFTVSLMLSLS